jgi:hypothetical protein
MNAFWTIVLGIIGIILAIAVIRRIRYNKVIPREYTQLEKNFMDGRNKFCRYCGKELKYYFNTGKEYDTETGKPITEPTKASIWCTCGKYERHYNHLYDDRWELKKEVNGNTITTYG